MLKDVLIEIWQANAEGKYAHPADRQPGKAVDPNFRGWGRACTDFETGVYTFDTIKPGRRSTGRNGRPMAPHINVWIVARGINLGPEHAHVLQRRGRGEREGRGAQPDRVGSAPRRR